MEAKEYQNLAMRTNDGNGTERLEKWIREETGAEYKGDVMVENEIDAGGLLNGCLGLSGEAGELNDLVKKWIFHKKPLDREHMKKEIGDVCWYIADICHSMGFDLGEIFQMNIDKFNPKPETLIEFDYSFPIETAKPLRKSCNIAEEGWCEIKKYTRNKVAYSMDGENYSAVYDTTAEALEDARNEIEYMIESRKKGYKVVLPERVFVGECELYRPSLLSCGYDVIEAVQADAYDEGGEYAENYLDDVTKEQREELEEQLDVVFNAWLEKHDLYPNFYTIPAHETYKYIDGKFEREEE